MLSLKYHRIVQFVIQTEAIACKRLFASEPSSSSKLTVLYDFHLKHGGKMVDFAGWLMPVQYKSLGIVGSHLHTRKKCSLFDVSHMLQTKVHGKDKEAFIESLVVGDIKRLSSNSGTLSLFTNHSGGILDDVIVSKTNENYLYLVSNAGCSDKIQTHLKNAAADFKRHNKSIEVVHLNNGLLALQGPSMQKVLAKGLDFDLTTLSFMQNQEATVFGVRNCRVTRCGYTGEDGVEISVPKEKTDELAEILLSDPEVELAGLGPRDSLRLEAGLCLYGNDIDESTTPVEAGLTWCIGKRRRTEANFPGAAIILEQIKNKPTKRRVGLIVKGAIARTDAPVLDGKENIVGHVTSGCPSPSLSANIAMAYVPLNMSKIGTKVNVQVRKKLNKAIVTKLPFVPTNYYFNET